MRKLLEMYKGKLTDITYGSDLVDGCKYMLHFDNVDHSIHGNSYPVASIKELHEVMKDF